MPVCVGARAVGGWGGGGTSGHTMDRCLALQSLTRSDGFGRPRPLLAWLVSLPGTSRSAGWGGGGGALGHTMGRCLARLFYARSVGVGCPHLPLTRPVSHPGTRR